MKGFIEKIKKYFSAKKKKADKAYSLHPYRDWRTLFVVVILVIVAVSSYCIYVFIAIGKGDFQEGKSSSKIKEEKKFDQKKLIDALSKFKSRQDEYINRTNNLPTTPDPSY